MSISNKFIIFKTIGIQKNTNRIKIIITHQYYIVIFNLKLMINHHI